MTAFQTTQTMGAAAPRPLPASAEGASWPSPSRTLTDQEIAVRTLGGDREAFAAIVARYESAVYGIAYSVLQDRDDAEDIAQEAFVKAFANLKAYDQRRPFKPWLCRIAANAAVSRLRRRRPAASLDEWSSDRLPAVSAEPDPVRAEVERRELQGKLDQAVDRLPEDARLLFTLRYREDLSVQEVAEALGRKPNAVAVALHRLRLRLRDIVLGEARIRETR